LKIMSECEFCHPEGYCEYEGKCQFRGSFRICHATLEDLIEICEDCGKPIENCDCGTNWVLLENKDGEFVPVTPKNYNMLKMRGKNHG